MNTLHFLKDSLGWLAMIAFAASYLCRSAVGLRRAQAGAATVWIMYGVAAGTMPVIISNVVVAFMAVIYPWLKRQVAQSPAPEITRSTAGYPISPLLANRPR